MSKPICTTCGLEMSITRIGVPVIYMFQDPPQPYRIRYGDQYQCSLCGKTTINGMADKGTEHFQDEFKEELDRINKSGKPVIVWERIKDAKDNNIQQASTPSELETK